MQLVYRGVQYQYNPVAVESHGTGLTENYRSSAAKFRRAVANSISPALQLIYRGDRYLRSAAVEAAQPTILAHPVTLTYRGMSYTKGGVNAQPQHADLTAQARQLTLQHRQKAEQRQLSVLGRFEAELGGSDHGWTVYDVHQAAMS